MPGTGSTGGRSHQTSSLGLVSKGEAEFQLKDVALSFSKSFLSEQREQPSKAKPFQCLGVSSRREGSVGMFQVSLLEASYFPPGIGMDCVCCCSKSISDL